MSSSGQQKNLLKYQKINNKHTKTKTELKSYNEDEYNKLELPCSSLFLQLAIASSSRIWRLFHLAVPLHAF